MLKLDVIRAWKDEEYRLSLSEAERAQLPEHPAGLVEVTDADVNGGGFANVIACSDQGCSCCCSFSTSTSLSANLLSRDMFLY